MKWSELNQYEREGARHHVAGYMVTRRNAEGDIEYFERAKAEALSNLQKQVDRVRCMCFQDMYPKAAIGAVRAPQQGTQQ
jgi:hypothetical protein